MIYVGESDQLELLAPKKLSLVLPMLRTAQCPQQDRIACRPVPSDEMLAGCHGVGAVSSGLRRCRPLAQTGPRLYFLCV